MIIESEIRAAILEDGRYGQDLQGRCVSPPIGCGEAVTPIVARGQRDAWAPWDEPPEGKGIAFKDMLSLREWQITGLCQRCQDEMEAEEHRREKEEAI